MIRTVAVVRDALILLALVIGPPAGLLAVAGSPIPDELPSAAVLQDWLHDPLQHRYVAVLATYTGWLLWVACTLLIAVTTARSLRRPRLRRLGRWRRFLPGPMQSLAATVVGAAAVTSAASPAALAAPATSSAAAVAPDADGDAVVAVPAPADTPTVAVTAIPPTTGAVSTSAQESAPTYTVQRRDTLFDIAARRLGDGNRWPQLYHLNRGRHFPGVGGTFTDPDLIYPGWTLTLPHPTTSGEDQPTTPTAPPTDAESASPGQPPTGLPGSAIPAPGASRHHTSEPATKPPPSTPAPDGDDASHRSSAAAPAPSDGAPPTATTTAASPPAAIEPDPHASDGEHRTATDDPGWIEITGGIISLSLAAGLLSAAAVVWRRRRHRYRPTPITSAADEADLTPPLPELTRLRHRVRRAAPHILTSATDPGPTVHEYVTAHPTPPPPPSGPTGADLAGLGRLATTGGVGVDGPGALDAARATVVAALTAGTADDPQLRGQVVTPGATLAELLGAAVIDLPATGRLTVASTFADALATVEEEIIRRSRIVADHDAADIAALRDPWTCAEHLPQLLLIADTPPETWQARLATAVQLGAPLNVGAVLIGSWPHGTTLTVANDGSTHGADGHRLAILDTAATAAMLTMLAEAHGDATPTVGPPPAEPDQDRPTTAGLNVPAGPSPAPPGLEGGATEPVIRRVRARVLGPPAILDAAGDPVRGLRTKALELFVYLVMHKGGATLTDIMEALWPDVTVSRAADRLSTCVANLRTTIRSIARTVAGPLDRTIEPVINTGGHYHLNPALLDVDWWTVLDAYTTVSSADDDDTRLAQLRTAIDAAGGHGLADDCDYEWIDTDREHVRRRLVKIYAQAAALLADSDSHTSRRLYDTACTLDPLSDELARCAMHATARLGDTDGVRQRLARLQHDLDEAGIDIDADTEHLAADLLHTVSSR